MLNLLFALLVCGGTFTVAVLRGVGTAFAWCFLPALLFFRPVEGTLLGNGLPELRISTASMIGLLGGMILRLGQQKKIRWTWTDLVIVAAVVFSVSSAVSNSEPTKVWHVGWDDFLKQLFSWLVPYFMARYCFLDAPTRKNCLWALMWSSIFLGLCAAIEFRFYPHFYAEKLGSTGLNVHYNLQAVMRGEFYRAETSFTHPIFFGDGCVSLFCLVLMLAVEFKGFWTRFTAFIALAAAFCSLGTSISFGPLAGFGVAAGTFFTLRYISFSRYVFGFAVVLAILGLGYVTYVAATFPTPAEEFRKKEDAGHLTDSFIVRWMIVQKCWPLAQDAGPLGHGREKLDEKDPIKNKPILELESVDNAYMLFLMVRGYVYSGLWALLPVCVAFRVSKAMRRTKQKEFLFPLAVGAGSSIGVSLAFYFVYAGWFPEPYTILWLIAIAFTMSLCDACFDGIKAGVGVPLAGPQAVPAPTFPPARPVSYPLPHAARIHQM